MFPRRRTDEVYRTLQQVQRRITEQGGAPTAAAVPAGLQSSASPRSLGNPTPGPLPALRPGPSIPDAPVAPPPLLLPPGHGSHQRYDVTMTGTLAALLMVCWLASLAVAVLVTWQVSRATGSAPQAPAEVAFRASAAVAPTTSKGWMLVVRSDPRATAEVRSQFRADADRLNKVMEQNARRGWKPWFEVVEPGNGHVQLVFAKQGVEKAEWADFYTSLTKSRQYAGATWVEVR